MWGSLADTFRQALAWLPISGFRGKSEKDQSLGASVGAPGEFPQAFTHLALIEAVSMLTGREAAERSASTVS